MRNGKSGFWILPTAFFLLPSAAAACSFPSSLCDSLAPKYSEQPMVINTTPKSQPTRFLFFLAVCFLTITSSATHVVAQEKSWKPGDRVEVEWKGDWYQAEVIEVKGNQYKVHYDGYASSWDEWVDTSRVRIPAIKPNNPTITSKSSSSAFDQVL